MTTPQPDSPLPKHLSPEAKQRIKQYIDANMSSPSQWHAESLRLQAQRQEQLRRLQRRSQTQWSQPPPRVPQSPLFEGPSFPDSLTQIPIREMHHVSPFPQDETYRRPSRRVRLLARLLNLLPTRWTHR